MSDILEVSYTGDLLAHRRCPRAWSFEKYAGFHPYEQVQAMEGRLVHHALEWLTAKYKENGGTHATVAELREQLTLRFRVLWARGIRTTFESKQDTLDRVVGNLFPDGTMHLTVQAAIEGAQHTEYELRAVRKLVEADFFGKTKMLLTGILDLVIQQQDEFTYDRTWQWLDRSKLQGESAVSPTIAKRGDFEIWDYKATHADTSHVESYVLQLLTYAALYQERTGEIPVRCVLFFVNEPKRSDQLLAIPIDEEILGLAEEWTINQVQALRNTMITFERDPMSVEGGDLSKRDQEEGKRVDNELKKQCTACGHRFDCAEYRAHLANPDHADLSLDNVKKN